MQEEIVSINQLTPMVLKTKRREQPADEYKIEENIVFVDIFNEKIYGITNDKIHDEFLNIIRSKKQEQIKASLPKDGKTLWDKTAAHLNTAKELDAR